MKLLLSACGGDVCGDGVGASGKGDKGHEYEYVNEAGSWTGRGSGETVASGLSIPEKEYMAVSTDPKISLPLPARSVIFLGLQLQEAA